MREEVFGLFWLEGRVSHGLMTWRMKDVGFDSGLVGIDGLDWMLLQFWWLLFFFFFFFSFFFFLLFFFFFFFFLSKYNEITSLKTSNTNSCLPKTLRALTFVIKDSKGTKYINCYHTGLIPLVGPITRESIPNSTQMDHFYLIDFFIFSKLRL